MIYEKFKYLQLQYLLKSAKSSEELLHIYHKIRMLYSCLRTLRSVDT